jgi:hypothetical protein
LTGSTPPTLLILLTDEADQDRIVVRLDRFVKFSEGISMGLEDIVGRWRGVRAPGALVQSRSLPSKAGLGW